MKELAYEVLLHSHMYDEQGYLNYQLSELQYTLGKALVAELWNSKTPVVVDLRPYESRAPSHYDWDRKCLGVRARYNPVHVHSIDLDYHIAELNQVIHVPHFQYFPKDWVCKKCGCIVDGFNAPRLCDRCGAPRSPRDAMLEAKEYA